MKRLILIVLLASFVAVSFFTDSMAEEMGIVGMRYYVQQVKDYADVGLEGHNA